MQMFFKKKKRNRYMYKRELEYHGEEINQLIKVSMKLLFNVKVKKKKMYENKMIRLGFLIRWLVSNGPILLSTSRRIIHITGVIQSATRNVWITGQLMHPFKCILAEHFFTKLSQTLPSSATHHFLSRSPISTFLLLSLLTNPFTFTHLHQPSLCPQSKLTKNPTYISI